MDDHATICLIYFLNSLGRVPALMILGVCSKIQQLYLRNGAQEHSVDLPNLDLYLKSFNEWSLVDVYLAMVNSFCLSILSIS